MVHLPEPLASIERTPLLFPYPSPLHAMPRLTEHIHNISSSRAQVWAKREDCSSGLGLGGNKIRKLEYIAPEVLARGSTTVITTGAIQSNHMRQVAAVASKLGLDTVLVPQPPPSSNPSTFYEAGNVQVNKILGAEIAKPGKSMEDVAADVKSEGGVPYIISAGGSAHIYGGLGFARWAFEVVEQEQELGVFFDVIVVPVASGGTLGGMIAGFKLADPPTSPRKRKIIGIDTYNKPAGVLENAILEIAQRTAGVIGLGRSVIQAHDVILDTRYNFGTHTDWDDHAQRGVRTLGDSEGIVSDPIYSGRTIGAILDMAQKGELDQSKQVLFVHTGGQAALSAFPRAVQ